MDEIGAEHDEKTAELEDQLRELDGSADPRARVELLNQLGWEIGLQDPARTRLVSQEALALAEQLDDRMGIANATRNLAYAHLLSSELAEALTTARQAQEAFHDLSDAYGEASALNIIAVAYSRLGDYDKALDAAVAALPLNQAAGDRRGEAWAWIEIGNVHLAVGDLTPARENFEKGLAIFEEIGYEAGASRGVVLLGTVLERSGDLDGALQSYQRGLEMAHKTGVPIAVAGVLASIGRVYHVRGELAEARRYYTDAIEQSKDLPLREMRANAYLNLGVLDTEAGQYESACELLRSALELTSDTTVPQTQSRIHEALSNLYEAMGKHHLALKHFKEYHRLKEEAFGEDGRVRLKNLQIRMGVERAETEAELNRLRFVELAGMQAQLVQSEKMALLGKLVAGLSHELNTPVGVINANASLGVKALARALQEISEHDLEETLEASSGWRRAIESLEASHVATATAGRRIDEMVRSLKNYVHLDESERQRMDVSELLRETLRLFETQLPASVNLEPRLEPLAEIECSPGELNQAFMTLLVNAAEAIDEAGTIRVIARSEEERLLVEIADTGRGIPEENLAKLFDIGFSTKDAQVRLRMGLSTTKSIIEKHGGTIEIESTVGKGTSFRIQLPVS